MAEINNSSVLDRILEYARSLGGASGAAMTAERFLLSLIDTVEGVSGVELSGAERSELSELLARNLSASGSDFSEIRAQLRSRIGEKRSTGYLDSLAILSSGEWVCDHGPGKVQYLNNYRGYTHHPDEWGIYEGKRLTPKRGEIYEIIHYIPGPTRSGWMVDMEHMPPRMVLYEGPQYTEEELLEMYGMWKAPGYHPEREFYEPDELDLASATPDFRNLLQWRPAVLTDENGVAEIPFAASDVNTEFIGLVEAVDGTGGLGCRTFTFRVVKL